MTNSLPGTGSGRRRPLSSGSPSRICAQRTPSTWPSPTIATGLTRKRISTPSCARELDLVLVRGHLVLGAPVEQQRDVGAEALGLDGDVDGRVAAADDGDAAPDGGRLAGLELLDERQRLPDAFEVVAVVGDVGVGAHADGEHDRVEHVLELAQPCGVDARRRAGTRRRAPRAAAPRRAAARSTAGTARSRSGRARRPPRARRRRSRRSRARRARRRRRDRPARRRRPRPGCRWAAPARAGARRWRRPTRSRSAGARRSRSAGRPSWSRTQSRWQSISTGQTRAQVPPRTFSAKIVARGRRRGRRRRSAPTNRGTSTPAGQATAHGAGAWGRRTRGSGRPRRARPPP